MSAYVTSNGNILEVYTVIFFVKSAWRQSMESENYHKLKKKNKKSIR